MDSGQRVLIENLLAVGAGNARVLNISFGLFPWLAGGFWRGGSSAAATAAGLTCLSLVSSSVCPTRTIAEVFGEGLQIGHHADFFQTSSARFWAHPQSGPRFRLPDSAPAASCESRAGSGSDRVSQGIGSPPSCNRGMGDVHTRVKMKAVGTRCARSHSSSLLMSVVCPSLLRRSATQNPCGSECRRSNTPTPPRCAGSEKDNAGRD